MAEHLKARLQEFMDENPEKVSLKGRTFISQWTLCPSQRKKRRNWIVLILTRGTCKCPKQWRGAFKWFSVECQNWQNVTGRKFRQNANSPGWKRKILWKVEHGREEEQQCKKLRLMESQFQQLKQLASLRALTPISSPKYSSKKKRISVTNRKPDAGRYRRIINAGGKGVTLEEKWKKWRKNWSFTKSNRHKNKHQRG